MLKLTDWEGGTPIYVRPEWIMAIYRLPAYGTITARTVVNTKCDGHHLVTELPDDIYRSIVSLDVAKMKGILDALQRFERCEKDSQ